MVPMPTMSRSASMMGQDGRDVLRLYASGTYLADFFDQSRSKPQDGH